MGRQNPIPTKTGQRFKWMEKHDNMFHLLKRKIIEAPMLALSNLQRTFELEANASRYMMGAILMQDGLLVAYHFEIFISKELSYL